MIHALMSCRLIALEKNPGVRPIGIGECLTRILSECIIEVSKHDVKEVCQADQLCSGLNSGIEGAVRAMSQVFESKCLPNSKWGLLVMDAKNAFNVANRQLALWQG
uniref:Reverse transcriptase n=1 Tax=Cacopsylla melanoneura TaxID=428564 RepID=A0A8D8XEY0_9HEMI